MAAVNLVSLTTKLADLVGSPRGRTPQCQLLCGQTSPVSSQNTNCGPTSAPEGTRAEAHRFCPTGPDVTPQGERAVAALEFPRCGSPAMAKKATLHCSDIQCGPTCGYAVCGRSFNSERSVSNHARRAHAEWYHQVITEQNELVRPKKSTVWNDAEILEVVLDTLELGGQVVLCRPSLN